MPILNFTKLDSQRFTLNIDNDQINAETSLDFIKNQVREVIGDNNFNLFVPPQDNPNLNLTNIAKNVSC